MTTVAWRPGMLATDTLSVDTAWLKTPCRKMYRSSEFILAGAGYLHHLLGHYRRIKDMKLGDILQLGYPSYNMDSNSPAMILCDPNAPHLAFELTGDQWDQIRTPYWAVGSGRDYALVAMYLGKSPKEAVEVAMQFDAKTGLEIDVALIGD